MRVRTDAPGSNELGRLLKEFRWRFQLKQADAAKVFGVGLTTVSSYESGFDTKTKEPINPRDNTLELMARRMVEYAEQQDQPLGKTPKQLFEELRIAAGRAPAEEKAPKLDDEGREAAQRLAQAGKSSPAFRQLEEQAKLKLLDGGIDGRFEPTEDELTIIQQAEEEDVWFGILSQPGFWDDPPEDRRSTFRYLEGLIDEARRFKRRHSIK